MKQLIILHRLLMPRLSELDNSAYFILKIVAPAELKSQELNRLQYILLREFFLLL